MSDVVLAIHEAGGQDVTMQKELAYSLVSVGGANRVKGIRVLL